jgi:hypothetical protein
VVVARLRRGRSGGASVDRDPGVPRAPTPRLVVIRIHSVRGSRDLESYALAVEFLYRVVRRLRRIVVPLVGSGRYRRLVSALAVEILGFAVGGHGTPRLDSGRGRYRVVEGSPLVPPSTLASLGLRPREFGADLLAVVSGVPELHLKVYTTGPEVIGYVVPLGVPGA